MSNVHVAQCHIACQLGQPCDITRASPRQALILQLDPHGSDVFGDFFDQVLELSRFFLAFEEGQGDRLQAGTEGLKGFPEVTHCCQLDTSVVFS